MTDAANDNDLHIDPDSDFTMRALHASIDAIEQMLLGAQAEDNALRAELARTQKLLMAYRILLTGSLIVNARSDGVDPAEYAPDYFANLMSMGVYGGSFAAEGVDGETLNIVCDQLHLPRFELEEEPRG